MPAPDNLTVIVLAAGGGTRMKSKTMKVLHPVGGRSMIGHVLARRAGDRAAAGRRGGRPPARAGRSAHPGAGARRGARGPGDAGRHRARRPGRDGGVPARRPGTVIVAAGDTPLLRGGEPAGVRRRARGGPAGGEHPERASWPTRSATAGSSATTRATSRRSSRRRTRRREQREIREINSGILAFDAEFLARGAAADRQRQRQGRVLPDRRRRSSPATPA